MNADPFLSPADARRGPLLLDLDGVLVRKDTMAAVVLARLRRRPWRVPQVLPLALLAAAAAPDGDLRPRLHRRIVATSLGRMSPKAYTHAASALVSRVARSGIDEDLAEVARKALARGETVVIITASEQRLVQELMQRIGLGSAMVIGSHLVFAERTRFSWHNIGPHKVEALRARGIDVSSALLFTDSASDLPLMRVVGGTILVDPSARSLRRIRRSGFAPQRVPDAAPQGRQETRRRWWSV